MALIVEDGTGLANAESYASVAEANSYHTNYGNSSWPSANTEQKEVALRNATEYLDAYFNGTWKGNAKTEIQALAWPRQEVIDEEDRAVDDSSVPIKLKYATSYLALRALTESLMPDQQDTSGVTYERKKLGQMEKETRWEGTGGKVGFKTFTKVNRMLSGYVFDHF